MYEMAIKFRNVKNGRYFYVCLYQDLLGDWIMSSYRGGRFKHHGWHKLITDIDAALREIAAFIKTRLQHGYQRA